MGAKFIWQNEIVIEIIMLIINILLGVGVITMFLRALNNSDELQQKIQLEALALAFGVGIIGGAAYSLLDATALISKGDVQISFLLLLMIFTYMVGVNNR